MEHSTNPQTGVQILACESWDEFVTQTRSLTGTQHIFRGHAEPDWKLASELDRLAGSDNGPGFLRSTFIRDALGEALVQGFRERAVGYLGDGARLLGEDEWEALGRHNGLVTGLLDWTQSPFVAAFFAFVSKAEATIQGFDKGLWGMDGLNFPEISPDSRVAVWALRTSSVFLAGEFMMVSPLAFGNSRQQAQRGVYTRLRHPDHHDVAAYLRARDRQHQLTCWTIPFADVRVALLELRRMNVTWATLFPDLVGAAKEANGISAWGHPGIAAAGPANPMQVFGLTGLGDVVEGSEVVAFVAGTIAGTSRADKDGWVIDIQSGWNGDPIAFALDGIPTQESTTYEGFGGAEVILTKRLPAPS